MCQGFGRDCGNGSNIQVNFVQGRGRNMANTLVPIARRNGALFENVHCFQCNRYGHYSNQWNKGERKQSVNNQDTNKDRQGTNAVLNGVQCKKGNTNVSDQSWLLLYSWSTDLCTNNPANILKCRRGSELSLHTNGGKICFEQKGTFKIIPLEMYYNPGSI